MGTCRCPEAWLPARGETVGPACCDGSLPWSRTLLPLGPGGAAVSGTGRGIPLPSTHGLSGLCAPVLLEDGARPGKRPSAVLTGRGVSSLPVLFLTQRLVLR